MTKRLLVAGALGLAATTTFANTLFDAVTSANGTIYSYGTSAPYDNQQDEDMILSSAASLSSMDFDLVCTAATAGDLVLSMSFYNTFTDSYTSSAPEMSGLIGTSTVDLGAATNLSAGFYYVYTAQTLSAPINVPQNVGVTFTWLLNGAPATGVEMGLNLTAAPTIGNNYDTVSGTGFNLMWHGNSVAAGSVPAGTSYLYFGSAAENAAVRFYGTPAPEPVSMAFLGLGVVGLIARRRNRS